MSDSQAPDMILPASLDIQQAAPLQARLLALRGQAVTLDGNRINPAAAASDRNSGAFPGNT